MKRRIAIIFVFLLVGALVNVAVAWAGAKWTDVSVMASFAELSDAPVVTSKERSHLLELGWTAGSPDNTKVYEVHGITVESIGLSRRVWFEREFVDQNERNQSPVMYFPYRLAATRFDAGFPCRSMTGEAWSTAPWWQISGPMPRWIPVHAIVIPISGTSVWGSFRLLPLRPLWQGFACNTVFYAALLWLLMAFPLTLRRWRRRRRNLCPACAYPVGVSATCTECGKPVRPRITPSTS